MYKKDIRQRLSFFDGTYFVIASMVGTGIFTSLGYQLINIKSGSGQVSGYRSSWRQNNY